MHRARRMINTEKTCVHAVSAFPGERQTPSVRELLSRKTSAFELPPGDMQRSRNGRRHRCVLGVSSPGGQKPQFPWHMPQTLRLITQNNFNNNKTLYAWKEMQEGSTNMWAWPHPGSGKAGGAAGAKTGTHGTSLLHTFFTLLLTI